MAGRRKQTKFKIVAAVLIIAIFFMGVSFAVSSSGGEWIVNNTLQSIFSPVQNVFSDISAKVGDFFGSFGNVKEYKEENLELKARVDELLGNEREVEAFKQENQRLRELLELKDSSKKYDMVGCEVIAKDPGNWFDVFTIDKGSNYGIKTDDVVITNAGLVGRVSEVGANWAKVTSIIDVDASCGAVIMRTQDIAVCSGDMLLRDSGKCRISYVTGSAAPVIGDYVETSGLGGIYPKGLYIGTVTELNNDESGYSKYGVVETAVDFERIREVLVIRMDRE